MKKYTLLLLVLMLIISMFFNWHFWKQADNTASQLTAQREELDRLGKIEKYLAANSLTALTGHATSPDEIYFTWAPPVPDGSSLVFFKDFCSRPDEKTERPPFRITPLADGQTSYSETSLVGSGIPTGVFCGQIWKDFEGGVPASEPVRVEIPQIFPHV